MEKPQRVPARLDGVLPSEHRTGRHCGHCDTLDAHISRRRLRAIVVLRQKKRKRGILFNHLLKRAHRQPGGSMRGRQPLSRRGTWWQSRSGANEQGISQQRLVRRETGVSGAALAPTAIRLEAPPCGIPVLKSRMCGPQVRFCESCGGAIPRGYSAWWSAGTPTGCSRSRAQREQRPNHDGPPLQPGSFPRSRDAAQFKFAPLFLEQGANLE